MKTKRPIFINFIEVTKLFVEAIKRDKRKFKHGVIRYEILQQGDWRTINCIDRNLFANHDYNLKSQGFVETQRRKVKLGSIPAELVILRNVDETTEFYQFDSGCVGYFKADCEITYFEVVL